MNYIDPKPVDSVKSAGFMSGDGQKAQSVRNANWDSDLEDSEDFPPPVKRLLFLQGLVTLLSWAAWSAKGKPFGLDSAAISALLGGLAAIVPATLFAMRAKVLSSRTNVMGASVFALVTGELIKIIATVAMFVLIIVLYPKLDWLPLLLTYVLALKCYWLAWILRK
jgi:ATP synthase protein I